MIWFNTRGHGPLEIFMKQLIIAFFVFFSTLSFASVDVRGLTDAQVAEIKAQAAQLAAQNAKGSDNSPSAIAEFVSTWGTQAAAAAEGFARAFGIAARELNVTVNEFFQTDVGKLTAAVIIWKMMGESILSVLFAFSILVVGLGFARVIYVRLFTSTEVRLPYSRFWGLWSGERLVRQKKSISDLTNDGEWMTFWVLIGVVAITLLVSGNIIF